MKSDQQAFWQNMSKISKNKYQPHNSISEKEWFNHFQKVLEQDNYDEDSDDDFENCESDVYYDRPITREEVLLAIQRLKNGKAAGPDGIIGELLKHAGHLAVDFLVKFFNVLFDRGIYPDSWTESIIVPLFKKGNQNEPNNYKGISLCDISSKLYSSIISNRLQEWIEQNSLTGECQAGFKKDYSTVDHMFTLMAMIQKQFALNRVYGDCMMKVVNSYKYLGICFSTRLSFYHACQDLVSRAKRALLCIMSKLYRIDCNSIFLLFVLKIFDAQVQPIVLYGAEIWGLESCSLVIDNVHWFEMLFRCGQESPK